MSVIVVLQLSNTPAADREYLKTQMVFFCQNAVKKVVESIERKRFSAALQFCEVTVMYSYLYEPPGNTLKSLCTEKKTKNKKQTTNG